MFPTLRENYGNSTIVFPLMALMGIMFHADMWETLYAASLMYITAIALLMLDDMFAIEWTDTGALLSEEELVELDKLVAAAT